MRPALFYLTALVIGVLDQVTKAAIIDRLPEGASQPALGRILYLTHTHNKWGAFSLFQANNTVFVVIALVAMVALVAAYHRSHRQYLIVSAALGLALGGAVGNVIDRIRFHYVIDFFDFKGGTGHTLWPIFNIADSAITVGIILLGYHFLFHKEPQPQTAHPGAESEPTARQLKIEN